VMLRRNMRFPPWLSLFRVSHLPADRDRQRRYISVGYGHSLVRRNRSATSRQLGRRERSRVSEGSGPDVVISLGSVAKDAMNRHFWIRATVVTAELDEKCDHERLPGISGRESGASIRFRQLRWTRPPTPDARHHPVLINSALWRLSMLLLSGTFVPQGPPVGDTLRVHCGHSWGV